MKSFALLFAVSCLALATCSSDGGPGAAGTGGRGGGAAGTSGGGGSGGAGGTAGAGGIAGASGGSGGTGGNPACASAVATQSCTAEGTVCGSENCTTACQFCNLTRCMNGVWQRMEVAPVPCFSCGSAVQCQSYTQYCEITIGGVPGSIPSYRCPATPAACSPTPTCSCFQNQGVPGGSSCVQTVAGQVTVTLAAP